MAPRRTGTETGVDKPLEMSRGQTPMVIEEAPIGRRAETKCFCGAPGRQEGPCFVAFILRRLWTVSTLFWPGPLFWRECRSDERLCKGCTCFSSPPSPSPHELFRNLPNWGPRARDKTIGAFLAAPGWGPRRAEAAMTTSSRLEEAVVVAKGRLDENRAGLSTLHTMMMRSVTWDAMHRIGRASPVRHRHSTLCLGRRLSALAGSPCGQCGASCIVHRASCTTSRTGLQ